MSIEAVGCCGAYCGSCKVLHSDYCEGCKIGYLNGERDINKAKCKMKVCCISKQYNSCADCSELETCQIINDFFSKNGYKYKKYKQAIDFISQYGYENFLEIADNWNNAYGKYEK